MGIRAALGARPVALLATIVRQAMMIAAAGTAAGLLASILAIRSLSGFVPGAAISFVALAAAAVLVMTASFAACAVPSAKVLRIDPAAALRAD
jgi:ABC-type antimicrobial peptide transport system permease subunit